MLFGLERKAAAEFSFFRAIKLCLRFHLSSLKATQHHLSVDFVTHRHWLSLCFLAGLVVVKLFSQCQPHGFYPFALYRIAFRYDCS